MSGKEGSPCLEVLGVPGLTLEWVGEGETIAWTLDGEYGGDRAGAEIGVQAKAVTVCI